MCDMTRRMSVPRAISRNYSPGRRTAPRLRLSPSITNKEDFMKFKMRVLTAGLATACCLSAVPAFATDVLNLPASAGVPTSGDPSENCYMPSGISFVAPFDGTFCEVAFPLSVPVGHTIKQIAVLHGDNVNFPDPNIHVWLDERQLIAPFGYQVPFTWDNGSVQVLPLGSLQMTPLMAQFGKLFPDAFVVQPTYSYAVVVHLWHGALVEGLQITYE
jgi:hypothetical protein